MNVNTRRSMSPVVSSQAQSQLGHPVMVRLRLIGQMEAWTVNAANILPTGRKTRALLAILALSAPRPVLRGRLAEMLWSRRPEEQARASLRQEIHRLLDALGSVGDQIMSITRDHLMLRPGMVWLDVEEVLRANPGKPAALCLLDGELLEDLDGIDPAFDNWLAAERERLRDRARVLAEFMLRDQSDPDLTIPAAQQLLSIDRAHEGAWRALMRAYTARGERGMAIQAYERCRSVLTDLLDAQPSEETQRLAADIRASTTSGKSANLQAATAMGLRSDLMRDLRQHSRGPSPDMQPERRADSKTDMSAEPAAEQRRIDTRASLSLGLARVGVMPLQMTGIDDTRAHLAAGLAEEITASLSRSRSISLISSAALARLATQTREEAAIRRALNVDFLLDGSIQRESMRLRISMRLLDLRAGNQLVWQGRFDRNLQDVLTLQDDVAAELAAQLEPEILYLDAARAAARPSEEPCAHELTLRALPLLTRMDPAAAQQAGDLLREAVLLDPEHSAAHSWAAYWEVLTLRQGWAADPEASRAEAARLAERGMALDPQDARAFSVAGYVRARLQRRPREALALHQRALALNPSLAMAWGLSADAHLTLGELDEAQRQVSRGLHLAPRDQHGYLFGAVQTTIHLLRRDHEAALRTGREVSELHPGFSPGYHAYLAALGHLGHMEEAGMALGRLLALRPDFTVSRFIADSPFAPGEPASHFAEGLRLAGVPI